MRGKDTKEDARSPSAEDGLVPLHRLAHIAKSKEGELNQYLANYKMIYLAAVLKDAGTHMLVEDI